MVVVEHNMTTHSAHACGQLNTQTPTGDVHFMYALVAHVAVAIVQVPVPVVMESVPGERTFRGWSQPNVIMHALGNGFIWSLFDGVTPFVAQTLGQVDLTEASFV